MVCDRRSPAIVEWLLHGHGKDVEALDRIRLRIKNGWDIPASDEESARFLEMLAEKGDTDARVLLGLMLENGIGLASSESDALDHYMRAADEGDEFSAMKAGEICYYLGLA